MSNTSQPTIWTLTGPKPGDNNQVSALAEALGWPVIEKRLYYRRGELLSNRFLGPNLLGLDRIRSAPLQPPWPDLVISAGRRNEPVARWIRRAAGRRHPVRLVHLGRPWASVGHFDLIVTTPQYHLPRVANVLHNSLPLHRVHSDILAEHGARWQTRLNGLPRPFTVLLAGGSSANMVMDRATSQRLLSHTKTLVEKTGGSLLISTSKRTPAPAIEILSQSNGFPSHFHRWRPDDPDNPYLGFLALGDQFIVTGESISMLTEACATGKPVHIYCPGMGADAGHRAARPSRPSPRQRFNQLSNRHAPKRWRRDVRQIHRHLIDNGHAVWLGDPPPQDRSQEPPKDLDRAVKRVRKLMLQTHGR